jgi:GMP synthase-like glutamine amidotransferase
MSIRAEKTEWLVLRHVEHEHLGILARVIEQAGMQYRYMDVSRGAPIPKRLDGFSGLIVMGGPMGVYEASRYPFLLQEQDLIRQAIHTERPILGICLGAQLIAAALEARVYQGPQKEVGWYPVEVTGQDDLTGGLPPRFMAFHWHGDTFDLPPGAVRLFRSDHYENQGFRWGRNVCAIQFHLEITAEMVEEWLNERGCQTELAALPGIDAQMIRQQTPQWIGPLGESGRTVFTRFLSNAVDTSASRHQFG